MNYLRKKLAKILVVTLAATTLPIQAVAQPSVVGQDYVQETLASTTSGGLQVTTPSGIELGPVTYEGEGYEVTFKVQNKWDGAFNGEFIVRNTGEKAIENWRLGCAFEHDITQIWNGLLENHDGKDYILKNAGYNQDIQPGQSVSIGFKADWDSFIKAPESYDLIGDVQEAPDEDYTIAFKVTSDWGSAFNGEISITNNTEKVIEDWSLEFDFDRNIERFWTADIIENNDGHYVVKNAGYNANINPGQTIQLGFSGNPGNVDTEPKHYVLKHIGPEIDFDLDSDGDGLPDWVEENLGSDKYKVDTDGDGLTDADEVSKTQTDPLKVDTDEDGTNDGDEDIDEDGLTNLEEEGIGTEIAYEDSDFDGLLDGYEVKIGTNPLNSDSDFDGLSDADEFKYELDPLKPDTLDDGILDGKRTFEVTIGNLLEEENDSVKVELQIEGTAEQINNSGVEKVSENGLYLSNRVPGYLGNAFEFDIDDSINNAEIIFEVKQSEKRSVVDAEPSVYFWNEEMAFLEKVQTQSRKGNKLSITTSGSGKYMVLDSRIYDAIWKNDILLPDSSTEIKDIDIVFAIDSSGSMSWNDRYGIRKSETKNFINLLSKSDQGAIIDFDSQAVLYQEFTSDKELLKTAVNRINSSGGTESYRGLELALAQFGKASYSRNISAAYNENLITPIDSITKTEEGESNSPTISMRTQKYETRDANRYIFLLTDGEDNSVWDFNPLINEANEKEVTIYTVGLGSGVNSSLLESIATATDGRYIHANNADDLYGVFEEVSVDVTDFAKDTDDDGINDYYEKKMNSGELRLGDGTQFLGIDYNNDDMDNDTIKDGEEIVISAHKIPNLVNENEFKAVAYVKMLSNPLDKDSDGDGYKDGDDDRPMKWDVSHRDLAMLASMSYSFLPKHERIEDLPEILKEEMNNRFNQTANVNELKSWSVIDTWYRDAGLQIVAYKKDDNIVVAYRGTDEGYDWFNNATTYILGLSTHTGGSKKFIELIMDRYPHYNYYITGHSLGGHLAYNAAAEGIHKDIDAIKEIVTFNGLGLVLGITLVGDLWDEKQLLKKEEQITNYSVEGDPVSKGFLGFTTFQYGDTVTYPVSDKSNDDAHSMINFLDKLELYSRN